MQQHVELAALHPGAGDGKEPQQPDLIGLHAPKGGPPATSCPPAWWPECPASCRLRGGNGEDGEQADEQMGEGHVARLHLLIRAEAVQADEGEEHHHRHQVAQRQLHALALKWMR